MTEKSIQKKSILGISFLIVLFDQFSKSLVRQYLGPGLTPELIPKILRLRITSNTGAAFSILSESTEVLKIFSLAVIIGLFIWLRNQKFMPLWKGRAVSFLIGGSIGNGIDRWRLGYVTDFLELIPISFPIFNLADIAINFAIICFLFDYLAQRNGNKSLFG